MHVRIRTICACNKSPTPCPSKIKWSTPYSSPFSLFFPFSFVVVVAVVFFFFIVSLIISTFLVAQTMDYLPKSQQIPKSRLKSTQEMNSQEPGAGNSEWNLTHREDIPCHNQQQIRSHPLPQESSSSNPHQTRKLVCSLFQWMGQVLLKNTM